MNIPFKKYAMILGGLALLLLIFFFVYWFAIKKTGKSTSSNTSSQSTQSQSKSTSNSSGVRACVIPSKVVMSDFLGYSMKTLSEKYGGEYKVGADGYAWSIICESDNYWIDIAATKKDQIADYVIIQLKEFGSCTAGINNVLPWVDKSIKAVGYDPSTKGTPRYDTENDLSQVIYDNYNTGKQTIELIVECNVTGDNIEVDAITTNQ